MLTYMLYDSLKRQNIYVWRFDPMRLPKEFIYAGAAVLCVAAAGWFYTSDRRKAADVYEIPAQVTPTQGAGAAEPDPSGAPAKRIKVYIAGAVINPGVYELDDGSRVQDVLIMAGGATAEADMLRVNLAARVKDEQQIIVPKAGEAVDNLPPVGQNEDAGAKININTADESQLMQLPGVGTVTARNIIAYRTEHGAFAAIEDIQNVTRIGEKTFERLKDLITVD